jgi:voltage-dependent potassium channel beta subunit
VEYRFLGKSGLQVSALSFGSWVTFGDQVGLDVAMECMQAAYESGVNFFDNAEAYAHGKAESLMGEVVKKAGWKRSDLVISTKIFWGGKGVNDRGLSRKHIIEGTLASLVRLQMNYVDLIFCHRPDIYTPIEETVRAMNHILDQGWAFYWGTSEWSAEQIMQAHAVARREHLIPPTMEQPQYNMFYRERVESEYARLYAEVGLGTTIWSPLASGFLTGKYLNGVPEASRLDLDGYEWLRKRLESEEGQLQLEKVHQLKPVADRLDCTLAQLAIAWCLKNPNVSTVITGASRASQVKENMLALDIMPKLTENVLAEIDAILDNKPADLPDFR